MGSGPVCWNQQSIGVGIAKKLPKQEEQIKLQSEKKQQVKGCQLTENQKLNLLNERSDVKEQQHVRKMSSIERQKDSEEFILGEAKNLLESKNQQKENINSIMWNLEPSRFEGNNSSFTNSNTFQEICENKESYNDQMFQQEKQEDKKVHYQNSFSSLGTISEESSQRSQSSQYLSSNDGNFTSSSLCLYENEDKTEDNSDEKAEKDYVMVLISFLVVLGLSYLYLIIIM